MIVNYKTVLAEVRDDLSEQEWNDLFFKASFIYEQGKNGKDRDNFYNAMMALPVAHLGSILVESKISSWKGLHVNPMVPLLVEQQDGHIKSIVAQELCRLLSVLMYKFESSTSGSTKKTFASHEKCFVDSMRKNHGFDKFYFELSTSRRYGMAMSYEKAIDAALGIMPSYETVEQLVEKTKVIRTLYKCFKKPTPPTILSFLFDNEL